MGGVDGEEKRGRGFRADWIRYGWRRWGFVRSFVSGRSVGFWRDAISDSGLGGWMDVCTRWEMGWAGWLIGFRFLYVDLGFGV